MNRRSPRATRRRPVRALAALAVVAAVVVGIAAPAAAEDQLTIRSVDTTAFPEVSVNAIFSGTPPKPGEVRLRENGRLVEQVRVLPIGDTQIPVGVVLAIDVSNSMRDNDALVRAKAAAKRFVAEKLPNDRIAVVAFAAQARVVVNFTDDTQLLNDVIDGLGLQGGGTVLFDGVRKSVALFQESPGLQPNIVVLTDGADSGSASSLTQARAAAVDGKATVFTIGLDTPAFDAGPLQSLAGATGGAFHLASDPTGLNAVYDRVQVSLQNQYAIRYTSKATTPALDLLVTAGQLQDHANVPIGSVTAGANTEPQIVEGSKAPGFLTGTAGKILGAGLALAAVAMLVYGVVLIFVRERTALESALSPYSDEDDDEASGFRANVMFQQATDAAERFAEDRGIAEKVEALLERAHLPLRAGEALFFYAGIVVIGSALGALLFRSLFGILVTFIILALLPPAALNFMASQRQRKFMGQLPDTLQLLSGSLRAGYSLMQGVEAVSQEVDDPMGRELRRIVVESRLGRPLEEALEDAAARMDSDDFSWAVMAIKIQREVGGNLAELLDTVAETMIARERLRREIRALTAEGRISSWVLGILPVAMLLVLWMLNKDYIEVLFDETVGKAMLLGGAMLAAAGFYWLNKIVKIEI